MNTMPDSSVRPTLPAAAPDSHPTLRAPAYAAGLAHLPRGLPRSLEQLAREVIGDGYLDSRDDVEIEVDLLFMGM